MFEYLMPLLVMPTYENTLLDQTCRAAVERQIAYGAQRGVPWGISESGYNTVDAALNYQYRAFGVPGLGFKRGLAEDLVIAPYASALALMVAPEAACRNLQRLAADGLAGASASTRRSTTRRRALPRGQTSAIVRSFMAHHQGMSLLVARATCCSTGRCSGASSADPRFQATLLLLQERIPQAARVLPASRRALSTRAARRAARRRRCASSPTPDTPTPEVQLLSNGRYHVMVTNAGGGYSRWHDLAVTRWREDATRDHWGTFCYLRDVGERRVLVDRAPADAASRPTATRRSSPRRAPSSAAATTTSRRTPRSSSRPRTTSSCAALRITNRAADARTIEVTSYAEVVLAPPAADALHPAFSNLFVQTEIVARRARRSCARAGRARATSTPPWMFHLMAVHGARRRRRLVRDRPRALHRPRPHASPTPRAHARRRRAVGQRRARCSIRSSRSAAASRSRRGRRRPSTSSPASPRRATPASRSIGKYQDRRLADRVFDLAWTHSQVTLRQLNATEADAQLYGRLAGSVLYANAALRAEPAMLVAEPARPVRAVGLRDLRRPADRAAADRRRRRTSSSCASSCRRTPTGG